MALLTELSHPRSRRVTPSGDVPSRPSAESSRARLYGWEGVGAMALVSFGGSHYREMPKVEGVRSGG